jgi:hypothetical protein
MAASHCHAMHDEGEVLILCGWHAPTRIQPPSVLVLFVLVMSELKQLLNLQVLTVESFFAISLMLLLLQLLLSEKDLIVREEACRTGLLFGGFTGMFHAIRCILRRTRDKETPLNG